MFYNRIRNRKDCMHKNCIDFHGNKGQAKRLHDGKQE